MSKDADAFRTIGELSDELDVAQHILRYWETRFPQLQPLKRAGNRRYYRPEDVALVKRIHSLLNEDGSLATPSVWRRDDDPADSKKIAP